MIKIISSFFTVLLFLHSNTKFAYTEYKPKINKHTQKRIEYGCKRPKQWKSTKEIYPIYFENKAEGEFVNVLNFYCNVNTRDKILINSNVSDDVDIEYNFFFKDNKTNKLHYDRRFLRKSNKRRCKMTKGKWIVKDENNEDLIVEDPKLLQIDHILPFSYIRLNMKDCRKAVEYYNFMDNLEPVLAEVNNKKNNIICKTYELCERQKEICRKMAEHFQDENLCEDIIKHGEGNYKDNLEDDAESK